MQQTWTRLIAVLIVCGFLCCPTGDRGIAWAEGSQPSIGSGHQTEAWARSPVVQRRTANLFRSKCLLQPQPTIDSELARFLQPGDIVLYRSTQKEFLGSLISEFTRSPYSHAEIYVGNGWSVSASSVGVTFADTLHSGFVDVMRVAEGLTEEQKEIILERCYQTLGQPYEHLLLIGFPFWGRRAAAERAENQSYICSEHVAWCYRQASIDLVPGKALSMVAPADLAHSTSLVWLGSWHNGTRVVDAVPNVRQRLQGKPHWLATRLVHAFADPFTNRDAYYAALQLGLAPEPADDPLGSGRAPASALLYLLAMLLGVAGLMRLLSLLQRSFLQRLARLRPCLSRFRVYSCSPALVSGRTRVHRGARLSRTAWFGLLSRNHRDRRWTNSVMAGRSLCAAHPSG